MLYGYINENEVKNFIIYYENNIPKNERDIILNYSKISLNKYLPKFNIDEYNIILKFLVYCLYFLKQGLNIEIDPKYGSVSELDIFMRQLNLNNDRNFLAIVNLILPYIDDKDNSKNQKNIKNIKDIIETKDHNIETDSKLKYCNYLYDHSLIRSWEFNNTDDINRLRVNIEDKFPTTSNFLKISDCYYDKMFYFIIDTIKRTRYKLYINWTNIFPYNESNYITSKLYKNSFKYFEDDQIENLYFNVESRKFRFIWSNIFMNTSTIDKKYILDNTNSSIKKIRSYIKNSTIICNYYYGINVEDIYNTLSVDYYHSIKKVRWLMFEQLVSDYKILLIRILDDILGIQNIINLKNWNILDNFNQNEFKKKYKIIIESIKNRSGINEYSYSILIKVIVYLFIYFDVHYTGIGKLKKENLYNGLNLNDQDDDYKFKINEDELETILEFTNDEIIILNFKGIEIKRVNIIDILNSIKNIPEEDVYNFLFLEINKINNTPYKYLLFNNNDNKITLKNLKFSKNHNIIRDDYELTPKNYYNFSKSLLFKKTSNEQFSHLWDGLNVEERYIFCIRLDQSSYEQSWFKIPNILNKIYKRDNIGPITRAIFRNIKRELIDNVFLNLIRKGCLSKFEYNPEVSDVNIISDNFFQKMKMLDKNMKKFILTEDRKKQYKESYYYVNNKKFGDLENINVHDDKINTTLSLNYIDYIGEILKTGDMWFTFYAMDWISQIDFYLKFLNQRVMYVTGATGQGKSTQVPKLYLYGLKSFLYKNNGKVICTVPRIGPVLENVTSISKSMGVPYQKYNDKYKKDMNTFNATVQLKYADDSHVDINNDFYLRLVTDGMLLTELQINPLLKRKKIIKGESKVDPNIMMNEYNEYDIVMVDEAHEHNTNMDLILTMMRHTLFYNNDIKLSIISATMDKDEPTFRKFYRMVDDNLCYPINIHNFYYCLDRNLIDRRYHISPPGKTTQFKVTEFYNDSNLKDTYEINEELGIEKVKYIFENTKDGDILFFSTTGPKIVKIAEKLNKIIPLDCIAIPFYSKMPAKYQNYAKKIASFKKKIDIDKSDIVKVFIGKKKEDDAKKVQKGRYNRVCIIATNVAEASLTITSLRYIVDLGFQLIVEYDYDLKFDKVVTVKITEASRVQRKGRVGRVADGTIYHMYPKDSRKIVDGAYNISIINFAPSFTDLLTSNDEEKNEIINAEILFKLISMRKLSDDDIENIKKNPNQKLIYDQYKLSDDLFNGDYFGYVDYNELNFLGKGYFDYLFPSYYTGFSSDLLLDTSGHFYIVSPLETKIKRNIFTSNIIKNNSEVEDYIDINNIKDIYDSEYKNLNIIRYLDTNKLYKSNLNLELGEISGLIGSYDKRYIKSFVIANLLDISKEFIFINSILEVIDKNIDSLINHSTNKYFIKKKETENFIKVNKQYNSDLEYIYKIYNSFKNLISDDIINKKIYDSNSNLQDLLLNYLKLNDLNTDNLLNFCYEKNIDEKKYDEILNLLMKGDITLEGMNENDKINKINLEDLVNDNDFIKSYCTINKLNYNKISSGYIDYLNKISNSKIIELLDEDTNNDNIDNLEKILKLNVPNNIFEKIKFTYLYSNLDRILYLKNGNYYNLNTSLKLENEYTLLDKNSSLGFYLSEAIDFINPKIIKINILTNISKKDILEISPQIFYFSNSYVKDYVNIDDLNNNIDFIQKKFNKFTYPGQQKNVINNMYSKILNKLKSQKGGDIETIMNRDYMLTKIKLSTIKKFETLLDLFNPKEKKGIDKFDYGYIALGWKEVYGLHLIYENANKQVMIYSVHDKMNTLDKLVQKFRYDGKYVIVFN